MSTMLRSFLAMKDPITSFIRQNGPEFRELTFDWQKLQRYTDFLSPFEECTEIVSKAEYPTLNVVVPSFNVLLDFCEDTLVDWQC